LDQQEIDILRGSQEAVENDRITTNQHIFHVVGLKRRKQLQEFVKYVHPGSACELEDTKSGEGKKVLKEWKKMRKRGSGDKAKVR